jgi:AcrR family transcriptional regulator
MPTLRAARPVRKRPGRYHHGDLRQALIQAAVRTIDRDGVDALTLRSVGAALGVSRTALYRHFPDKETLLAAVAAEGFRTLQAALVNAWEGAGRGEDGFRAQGHAYLTFGTSHPAHYRVMFGGYLTRAVKGAGLEEAGRAAFMALVDALTDLQQRGAARADDAVLQAFHVWGTVHGITMLLLTNRVEADALPAYTVDRLVAGLRP